MFHIGSTINRKRLPSPFFFILLSLLLDQAVTIKRRSLKAVLLYGIGYGVLGMILMLYSVPVISGSVIFDFRAIAVLLPVMYGGLAPGLLAASIMALYRILMFGLNVRSILATTSLFLTVIGSVAIIRWIRVTHWKKWALMNLLNLFITTLFFSVVIPDLE